MSKLFILTNSYPYLDGESYFESELRRLSNSFDSITLFPIVANKKDVVTRYLPRGINVYPLSCAKSFLKHFIIGLFSKDKEFVVKNIGFKRWVFHKYAIGRKKAITRAILSYLHNNDVDMNDSIIYSYWLTFGGAAYDVAINLKKSGFKNVRCISRAHGYDLFWERRPLNYAPLQEKTIEKLDAVYSISNAGQDYLQNKYPQFKCKIRLSKLGTENVFADTLFNGSHAKNAFITCSNNRAVKRLPLFAKSFKELLKKDPNAMWHAVGLKGNETEIVNIFTDEDLKHIKFYGVLDNASVFSIYRSNSIGYLVNVSSSEGLPVSIMEALSFGVPVIATNVGGVKELVDDSCGFLIDENPSVEQLTNILYNASHLSDETYKKIILGARKRWEDNACADNNYKQWCEELKSL